MNEKQQQDKLRKQLLLQAETLTDSELIAFLLRSGSQGKTSVELAEELLTQMGGLSRLLLIPQQQFCQIKGLGESKYLSFRASTELAWRLHSLFEDIDTSLVLDKTLQFFLLELSSLYHKALYGLFLDKQHNPLAIEQIILDNAVDDAVAYGSNFVLKEVLKYASQYQATNFMLAHNYLCGDGCPMPVDISLSQNIVRELFAQELQMLDYVVIGGLHQHISLAQRGFLEL
jgi:DNA repair protein RadC